VAKHPAVYIMASGFNGTLYTGATSRLIPRVWQHRADAIDGFTKRYAVHRLVWFELHGSMDAAIQREKQIKKWPRDWKIRLIQAENPDWVDLWPRLAGEGEDGSPPPRG
jgi:putative endonuclease